MTDTPLLNHDSPAIVGFLTAWHEAGRAEFVRLYDMLDYDSYATKVAKTRRKYIALNRGGSGVFLIDRATSDVYSIKAYGVPNRKLGSLAAIFDRFRAGTMS